MLIKSVCMGILTIFENRPGGAKRADRTDTGSGGAPLKRRRRKGLVRGGKAPSQLAVDILLIAAAAGALVWCLFTALAGSDSVNVTLDVDGHTAVYSTDAGTVGDFLERRDIQLEPEDEIDPPLTSALSEGSVISLRRAYPVAVESKSHVTVLKMASGTVGDALEKAGVVYDADDELSSLAFEDVVPGMQIRHNDVQVQYTTTHKTITYRQETIKDDSEYESFKEVQQEGADGEKRITQRVTVKNGVEVSREIVDQTVLTPAVTEIVRVGTKIRYQTSYEGEWRRYMDRPVAGKNGWVAMTVYRVTAYCTGTRTATGTRPKLGTIAVNPKFIPYGTKIWVKGYGLGTAEDTGAFRNYESPKDTAIDLWFNTRKEAVKWGSKYNFTILVKTG